MTKPASRERMLDATEALMRERGLTGAGIQQVDFLVLRMSRRKHDDGDR